MKSESYSKEIFPIRSTMTEEMYEELRAWTLANCGGRGLRSWGHKSPRERLTMFLNKETFPFEEVGA